MQDEGSAASYRSWNFARQHAAIQYVLAAIGVVLATALRLPFEGFLHGTAPYALYYPVLVSVAWFFGTGPTLLAALLGWGAAWYFFIPEPYAFHFAQPGDASSFVLFGSTALVITWLSRVAAATREAALQALTEKERVYDERTQLAAIVESSEDAIVGKDLDGYVRSWNHAAERLFGYTAQEIIGRSGSLLLPTERRAEEEIILSRLKRGERVEHFETVRVTKTGRRLDVALTISPVKDASGQIVGASKIARDITDQKRIQREVLEQRERLRVTLASIGDAVIATDAGGFVNYLNPVAERLTGWSFDEAEGQPLAAVFRVVDEQSRALVEDPYAAVARTRAVLAPSAHTVLLSRQGDEYPIEESAAPILEAGEHMAGVVLVFHDVSERRKIERERSEAEQEREFLLQSERSARSEAERANRLKDEFLATVSHELRTPLNAILGWTDLLKRDSSDPTVLARGLSVIERNTRAQAQLIADLLDVSRIVSGKLRLDIRTTNLARVTEEALETVRTAADAKGLHLHLSIEPGCHDLLGDPDRLQQVVWNLLSNAVKFTPKDGTITVEVKSDAHETRVRVSDTGAGIPAGFLPHLFERFRQADSSTTRRFGGLGLGLTIVKQLVELHGGSVHAESEGEQRGASFEVRIPIHPDAAAFVGASAARSGPPSEPPPTPDQPLRGARVLLVEDDDDSREIVERVLREAGCVVRSTRSAQAALDEFARARPDLVISDIGLPDEDGYALIQRLRAAEAGAEPVPAIALTAFARQEDQQRALAAGFQMHLAKPVRPAQLLAHMTKAFTTASPAQQ